MEQKAEITILRQDTVKSNGQLINSESRSFESAAVTSISIGRRIRQLRVQKGLSQGDIEETTGLLRCYISRVEQGYTVPSLETLERFAAGLDLPLYRLFYTGDEEPPPAPGAPHKSLEELAKEGGAIGLDARFLLELKGYVERMAQPDRALLLDVAKKLAGR